ncbi:hypothetical protein SDC9_69720 [bioreactor metagenome]|uniref:Uncharacterized protein n=1 Tax=bioreactor metagenome TaxID=1076179 RepID=A0A644YAU4_9ZZZZ
MNLFAKVQNILTATFSRHHKCVAFKVDIAHIDSDQLTDTNSRAEEERKNRDVPQFCRIVILFLSVGETFAVFREIQQIRNLVWLQPDNCLIIELWNIDQSRNIRRQIFLLMQKFKKGANG